MTVYQRVILALWLLFAAYWLFAAFGAKRNVGGRSWGSTWVRGAGVRLALVLVALFLVSHHGLRSTLRQAQSYLPADALTGLIGVVLGALGVGLAIVARTYLGRNWGMPMSQKLEPELVTSGPYAFMRHPIYTGMLLALLGSAIGLSVLWALLLLLFAPYCLYAATREEQLLARQFPQQYPAYRQRTGMLLPRLSR